jgi:signal transduction histidine kinase
MVMVLLFAAMSWHLGLLFRGYQINQSALGQSGMQQRPGGTDWVNWENQNGDVVAQHVHPITEGNPIYANYIQKGDILRRIDGEDVYDQQVPTLVTLGSVPGTVLMYQIQRKAASGIDYEWINILVPIASHPRLSFVHHPWLWTGYPWLLAIGIFISLVSLLILFPILKPAIQDQWAALTLVVACFAVYILMGLHHANLLVRTGTPQEGIEPTLRLGITCILPLIGTLSLYSSLNGRFRFAILPVLLLNAMFLGWLLSTGFDDIDVYSWTAIEKGIWVLFTAPATGMVIFSMLNRWGDRSRLDKVFHVGAGLVLLHNWLLLWPETTVYFGVDPLELVTFLSTGALLLPLLSVGASQLKFGKVSLVLNSSLQFVLLSAAVLLLYYTLDKVLWWLGFQFPYQAYLEVFLLLVCLIFLRAIWKSNEGKWRPYFILSQQQRKERIAGFVARIPQYVSSAKLQDDLVDSIKQYFDIGFVALQIENLEAVGDAVSLPNEQRVIICKELSRQSGIWLRNRQIFSAKLPQQLESLLNDSPAAVVLPLTVNDELFGLLLLGPKKRGVYNLEDIEVLARLIQQTRLTLGVLHLLEREKLLLEKNYEANLTALRSQINPHFLFNTLNTISALIHDDPDGAEKAVEKLAFIFRYTLKYSDRAMLPLREELSLIRTYLEIEQIRFGKRLGLRFDLDDTLLDLEIPAFVLQTIVENCIKHGIARITGEGWVDIQLKKSGPYAICEISDNGPGIDLSRIKSSTGLNNIITRMAKIYGREDLLLFENTTPGTKVTIKIPAGI